MWRAFALISVAICLGGLIVPPDAGLWAFRVGAVTTVIALISLVKTAWVYTAVLSSHIFAYVSVMAGLLAAESGAHFLELQRVGYANGAGNLVLIFFIVFVWCSEWSFRRTRIWLFGRSMPAGGMAFQRLFALGALMVVTLVAVAVFAQYSSPLILGIERQTFLATLPAWGRLLPSAAAQAFVLALAIWFYSETRSWRRVGLAFVLIELAIVTLVLGQKFSGLLVFGCLYLAFHAGKGYKLHRKLVFGSLVFVLLSAVLIYIQYTYLGRDVVQFAMSRIALQGQLMWSVASDVQLNPWQSRHDVCLSSCGTYDGSEYALNWILPLHYLPPGVASDYWHGGSNLSGFEPATRIYIFGIPIALVLQATVGVVVGFLGAFVADMIGRANLLGTVIAFKMFDIAYWLTVSSDPGPLTSVPTIAVIFVGELYLLGIVSRSRAVELKRSG